jgi:hypothetical protein
MVEMFCREDRGDDPILGDREGPNEGDNEGDEPGVLPRDDVGDVGF